MNYIVNHHKDLQEITNYKIKLMAEQLMWEIVFKIVYNYKEIVIQEMEKDLQLVVHFSKHFICLI